MRTPTFRGTWGARWMGYGWLASTASITGSVMAVSRPGEGVKTMTRIMKGGVKMSRAFAYYEMNDKRWRMATSYTIRHGLSYVV